MFVDTAKVKLQAGHGGNGAISYRHEIYIPKGGPDGGDGGRGGSIIFRADKDTNTLLAFRYNPELKAEDGKPGAGTRSAGRSGKDLIVKVPVGTQIWRADSERVLLADLTSDGQEVIIARGGDGGFGNAHFKSSTRQTPNFAELGEPGEAFSVELELKLLADIGLVGLPNAGKSTFLSVVSNARPEIADYPFTTLTPQLGTVTVGDRDLLIADIPGLIEGAADGKGLGHAFLRHIDRTAVLLHLVDVYNDDAGAAYVTVRHELERYSSLASRPELVALTKCEGLDPEIIEMQRAAIVRLNPRAQVFAISAQAHIGLAELLNALMQACADSELSNDSARAREETLTSTREESSVAGEIPNRNFLNEPTRKSLFPERGGLVRKSESAQKELPTIELSPKAYKNTWTVEKQPDGTFKVSGEKIEKFARRTDIDNYESLNRLRDIMKKLGIRAELTNQGALPDSIISIADKEFTLVEDY